MLDHMKRRTIKLGTVTKVVLDEADEMLNMGFLEDIETILDATSASRQTLLFSATMPESIRRLASKYQKNPSVVKVVGRIDRREWISANRSETRNNSLAQYGCCFLNFSSSLIFCNTKRCVDEVARNLKALGYDTESIHGDMAQSQRDRVMSKFRRGHSTIPTILVATDVAARGIDVRNVDAVINYDVPRDDEYYVHRIGRTARMGKAGHAFTLVLPTEMGKLRDIQTYAKTTIKRHAPLSPETNSPYRKS